MTDDAAKAGIGRVAPRAASIEGAFSSRKER